MIQKRLSKRAITMTEATQTSQAGILMTDNAMKHVLELRQKHGQDLCLRVGVRGGGCSGMSYTMDFENPNNIQPSDQVFEYEQGFKVVSDPKSLLYIYGLVLDYSDALIGGGFQFTNPNASQTCGCGTSFAV
jgi:iron-sulfur cluster assembly protein